MTFVEKNLKDPVRHNPYLHQVVMDELKKLGPGRILDVPSGPGYLLRDLKRDGFSGVAAEINPALHCFDDLTYKQVDMCARFPFNDGEFNYVASIEGVEHIENHFAFLREVHRVLKPGGWLILTTPNVLSLESRWLFFTSGFHDLAKKPIPLDTENMYFEHIHPIDFNQLYFACEQCGLRVESLKTYRYRKGSWLLYALWSWLILWKIYSACFIREKNSARAKANARLYKFLSSKEALLGTHVIMMAQKL